MASSTRFDNIINKLNDQDWGWWPFLFIRPPKHVPVSIRRLAVMSLLYGIMFSIVGIVLFVGLGKAPWSLFRPGAAAACSAFAARGPNEAAE